MHYAALAGFGISLVVHLAALSGYDVSADYPYVMALHLGIFVFWFPAILKMKKRVAALPAEEQKKGLSLKLIFKGLPLWLRILALTFWLYAIPNFMYSMSQSLGTIDIKEGRYVLNNRGIEIREVSEAEFHQSEAMILRAFSGIWLLFYAAAAAFLFSGKDEK